MIHSNSFRHLRSFYPHALVATGGRPVRRICLVGSFLVVILGIAGQSLANPSLKTVKVPAGSDWVSAAVTLRYKADNKRNRKTFKVVPAFYNQDGALFAQGGKIVIKAGRRWKNFSVTYGLPSGTSEVRLERSRSRRGYKVRNVKIALAENNSDENRRGLENAVTGYGETESIRDYYVRTQIGGPYSYRVPTGLEDIPSSNALFEQEVFRLVNEYRVSMGQYPLVWNEPLAKAARYHAWDMAQNNYFDHDTYTRVDGELVWICRMCWRVGFFIDTYGNENIAAFQQTPEEVVTAWKNSPGHARNMIGLWKSTGIGYVDGRWVQDFLR